jgi:hypothetical protein
MTPKKKGNFWKTQQKLKKPRKKIYWQKLFSWISSIFVGVFKSSRFFVSPCISMKGNEKTKLVSNFLWILLFKYHITRVTYVWDVWAGIAQSVLQLTTDWTVRGSNAGGGEFFRSRPDRPWGPPSLLYYGCQVFPGVKEAGTWRWPPTTV